MLSIKLKKKGKKRKPTPTRKTYFLRENVYVCESIKKDLKGNSILERVEGWDSR